VADVDDVEKRWHDPRAFRAAVRYVVAVIAVAVVVFTGYVLGDQHDLGWAFATPGVLFVGALGAFVKTYRDWRAHRTWPIWHGAGWFLLTTTLMSFGIPTMGVLG
jgi:O-antigen/teichoic acid export membrane protein